MLPPGGDLSRALDPQALRRKGYIEDLHTGPEGFIFAIPGYHLSLQASLLLLCLHFLISGCLEYGRSTCELHKFPVSLPHLGNCQIVQKQLASFKVSVAVGQELLAFMEGSICHVIAAFSVVGTCMQEIPLSQMPRNHLSLGRHLREPSAFSLPLSFR